MKEQAPNNPDYLKHHPEAVENVDVAHTMASASNEQYTRARTLRQGAKLAIEAARAVEGAAGDATDDYAADRPEYYIYDKMVNGETKKAGLIREDIDVAIGISKGHADRLASTEGQVEISEHYERLADRADKLADEAAEAARAVEIDVHSDTYIIPINSDEKE